MSSHSHCRCRDCRQVACAYMVKNQVWAQAMPDYKEFKKQLARAAGPDCRVYVELCFECLSKRLGRALRIEDFSDGPINDGVKLGYQMGHVVTQRTHDMNTELPVQSADSQEVTKLLTLCRKLVAAIQWHDLVEDDLVQAALIDEPMHKPGCAREEPEIMAQRDGILYERARVNAYRDALVLQAQVVGETMLKGDAGIADKKPATPAFDFEEAAQRLAANWSANMRWVVCSKTASSARGEPVYIADPTTQGLKCFGWEVFRAGNAPTYTATTAADICGNNSDYVAVPYERMKVEGEGAKELALRTAIAFRASEIFFASLGREESKAEPAVVVELPPQAPPEEAKEKFYLVSTGVKKDTPYFLYPLPNGNTEIREECHAWTLDEILGTYATGNLWSVRAVVLPSRYLDEKTSKLLKYNCATLERIFPSLWYFVDAHQHKEKSKQCQQTAK